MHSFPITQFLHSFLVSLWLNVSTGPPQPLNSRLSVLYRWFTVYLQPNSLVFLSFLVAHPHTPSWSLRKLISDPQNLQLLSNLGLSYSLISFLVIHLHSTSHPLNSLSTAPDRFQILFSPFPILPTLKPSPQKAGNIVLVPSSDLRHFQHLDNAPESVRTEGPLASYRPS